MIIKLDKDRATTTEDIGSNIFFYFEDEFSFYPYRREKAKFLEIKDNKDLDFLGTLKLRIWMDWDALEWQKKQ